MKVLILLFCILLLSYPAAAADSGPFDIGTDMVKNGFVEFIKALGSEAFASVGVNGSQSSVDAYVQLSTFTFDPFEFPKVKELNFISGVISFLFVLLYIGAGAAWAILCRVSPGMAMNVAEITDIDRDIAGRKYVQNISICVTALLFGHVIIRLILVFNYVLSSLVAKYTLISTIDSSSNFLLYFFSGLVFFINAIFYCWRLIVICAIASFSLIVGAMLIWGYTRNIAISIIKYFIGIVFLQLIIVAVIAAGMIAADVVNSFNIQDMPFAQNLPAFILLAVLLMSVLVSLVICLGPLFNPTLRVVSRL